MRPLAPALPPNSLRALLLLAAAALPACGSFGITPDGKLLDTAKGGENGGGGTEEGLKITSLDPAVGPTAGGTEVVVRGQGFLEGTVLSFMSAELSTTVVSDTELLIVTPAARAGLVDVTVKNDLGSVTLFDGFEYTDGSADGGDGGSGDGSGGSGDVSISTISPAYGPTSGGTDVYISGVGFSGDVSVRFGTASATSITRIDEYSLRAITPAGAEGVVDVTVESDEGWYTKAGGFEYIGDGGGGSSGGGSSGGGSSGGGSGGGGRSLTGSAAFLHWNSQLGVFGDWDCDLAFSVTGSERSSPCAGCDFAFDITWTYNAAASVDYLGCASGNLTWRMAHDSDYLFGTPALLYSYGGGYIPISYDTTVSGTSWDWVVENYYYDWFYGYYYYSFWVQYSSMR